MRTTDVPPGWESWYAFINGAPDERSYTVNENGTLKTYAQNKPHDTYYVRDKAEAFIRSHAQGRPWFAWVNTHAPHGPITIAPEFRSSYNKVKMPRPPSYNEANVSDKPAWIQRRPLLDHNCSTNEGPYDCHKQVAAEWRTRQESLMSVDVMAELYCPCPQRHKLWGEFWWTEGKYRWVFFDDHEASETYAEQVENCPACGRRLERKNLRQAVRTAG